MLAHVKFHAVSPVSLNLPLPFSPPPPHRFVPDWLRFVFTPYSPFVPAQTTSYESIHRGSTSAQACHKGWVKRIALRPWTPFCELIAHHPFVSVESTRKRRLSNSLHQLCEPGDVFFCYLLECSVLFMPTLEFQLHLEALFIFLGSQLVTFCFLFSLVFRIFHDIS